MIVFILLYAPGRNKCGKELIHLASLFWINKARQVSPSNRNNFIFTIFIYILIFNVSFYIYFYDYFVIIFIFSISIFLLQLLFPYGLLLVFE